MADGGQVIDAQMESGFKSASAFRAAFAKSVWDELRQIPPGQTHSYSDIAKQMGRPSASRAVARTNGATQIALIVTCHQVIGADGSLAGNGGGLWRKQKLLEIERYYRTIPRKRLGRRRLQQAVGQ